MIKNKVLGGIGFIVGTCIGAGILALPIVAAPIGFATSVGVFLICWLMMYLCGLLVLEVSVNLPDCPSYLSMAKVTLGKYGKFVTWLSFLFLFYSVLAAYFSGGGAIVNDVLKLAVRSTYPAWAGASIWFVCFSLVIYFGIRFADLTNRLLVIGLVAAVSALFALGVPEVKAFSVATGNLPYLTVAFPIVLAAFGFHIIIPTIKRYLAADVKKIKQILLVGSLATLVIYLIWNALVFGLLPMTGKHGLMTIARSGDAVSGLTQALSALLSNPWTGTLARAFAFFAIASSFLGVSYGLSDLIADGFNIQRDWKTRLLLVVLTLVPPMIYALYYPKGFVLALHFSGIFVAILHGILPALMAWRNRYHLGNRRAYEVVGGRSLLLIILLFFVGIIITDLAVSLGWLGIAI